VRDDIYLVDIVARAVPEERAKLETLRSLMITTSGGRSVPLEQMAKLSYGLEPPLIWRRQRLPTVTVQADTAPGVEAATVVKSLASEIAAFKSKLPAGYDVVPGGTVEESAKAEASIFAVFPLMLFIMITILMLRCRVFSGCSLWSRLDRSLSSGSPRHCLYRAHQWASSLSSASSR
jgi:multidrug efflux pump subunit AcrB